MLSLSPWCVWRAVRSTEERVSPSSRALSAPSGKSIGSCSAVRGRVLEALKMVKVRQAVVMAWRAMREDAFLSVKPFSLCRMTPDCFAFAPCYPDKCCQQQRLLRAAWVRGEEKAIWGSAGFPQRRAEQGLPRKQVAARC